MQCLVLLWQVWVKRASAGKSSSVAFPASRGVCVGGRGVRRPGLIGKCESLSMAVAQQ